MKIGVLKETVAGEYRCALVPSTIEKLVKLGIEVSFEPGVGDGAWISDDRFVKAGAKPLDRAGILAQDMVIRIRKPDMSEIGMLKNGAIHISFLDPYNEAGLIDQLAVGGVTAVSLEMIPRTTRAQKMDALSSQASLAGYSAVLVAADQLRKALPMMMTPAGTIRPAKVFIVGAGVAGLQAIATAKRLGARVEAFDTRPVVKEQVESLGAKFVEVDLGETGQTAGGYATALTDAQLEQQRVVMAKTCASADIVITTAQLFGRRAPVIITDAMIAQMKPGSVIVDMAIESGGNVTASQLNAVTTVNGVTIIGFGNLPARVATDASEMMSANIGHLIGDYWDGQSKKWGENQGDEILAGCIVTHGGQIVNPAVIASRKK